MVVVWKNGAECKKKAMNAKENPVILRQSFVKLWANNIFLPEEESNALQFISLFKIKLATEGLLHYRYHRVVASRTNKNDIDLDEYVNLYKYEKNRHRRRFRLKRNRHEVKRRISKPGGGWVWRKSKNFRFSFLARFRKGTLYQQLLHDFSDVSLKLSGLLFRVRQPLRRLAFFNDVIAKRFYKKIRRISSQKYFINTVFHIILLHYYKAVTSFAQHFGRELQKIRKQVHWRLIYNFKALLYRIPRMARVRRQLYGLTIEIRGRPRGRARTHIIRMSEGTVAPQTFRFRITLGCGVAFAKVGLFGIKTRIAY